MPRVPRWKEIPKYPVISGIALLAVGVTIAWWTGKNISPLFENAEIRRGQLWRLATSIFPHLDIFHLAFNLYWLWILGTTVERVYGHLRTILLILIFAIGSGSLEFAFASGGVGLSGVGYGLFGLLYVLSKHDERFSGSLDKRTVNLFVGWFFICILTTIAHIYNVANVAHASGAVLGLLLGYAIVLPSHRAPIAGSIAALVLFGFFGSTIGRPFINFSSQGGYEEGKWGYDALVANRNQEAVRWLRDAVKYQPKVSSYWFNLGIAYQRLNNQSAALFAHQRAYELQSTDPKYAEGTGKKIGTQFPVRKQTRYFDFRYERNSSQINGMARFADGYINIINRDFFKADFEYPIQVFVLEDQNRFEEFVHRELHVPGPAGFGIYLYSNKLLATYEDSGLGTFTHETLHAFVEKDLTHRPAWADEGIPTFFEKFYGYWKNDELVLFWGFQNPWRVKELGTNLTQLNLLEIISDQNPERDESKLRMVSLFLWEQGRFRRFLKLIAANDKRGYTSYFEAAMDLPFERIIPLWQNYLVDVERRRAAILSLPLSTVLDSEEAFQSFAKLHSISTEQVKQRD